MHYLYRFIDHDNQVIYIGQTKNLEQRIISHKFDRQSIFYNFDEEVAKIDYVQFNSKYRACIYEIHYIAKYRPYLNTEYNEYITDDELLELPEVEWKRYYTKEDIKCSLIMRYGDNKNINLLINDDSLLQRVFKLSDNNKHEEAKLLIESILFS